MRMALLFVLVLVFSLRILPEKQPMYADSPTDMTKAEKELILKLQGKSLWKDRAREDELLGLLKEAKTFRSKQLVKVLVKHIHYESSYGMGLKPVDIIWPVAGTLEAIGMPVVQPLLDELKTLVAVINEDIEDIDGILRQPRILHCLIDIYEQGGCGRAVVRFRIEKELEKCLESERKNLQGALQNAALKK